jgi:hypothetical protein
MIRKYADNQVREIIPNGGLEHARIFFLMPEAPYGSFPVNCIRIYTKILISWRVEKNFCLEEKIGGWKYYFKKSLI